MQKLYICALIVLSLCVGSSATAQESFPATHIARLDILDPHPDAGTIGGVAIADIEMPQISIDLRVSVNVPADSLFLFYRTESGETQKIWDWKFEENSTTVSGALVLSAVQFPRTIDSGRIWLMVTRKSDKTPYVEGPLQRIISAVAPEPSGDEVVPPVSTDGVAHFGMSYDPTSNSIHYTAWWLDLEGIATSARIGRGVKGSDGSFEFNIPLSMESDLAIGTWSQPSAAILEYARTGELYFEIATTAHPEGEIRGQIYPVEGFTAFLEPENEVPPATASNGSGSAYLLITAHGTNEVFNKLQGVAGQLTSATIMAHIHSGAIGVSGPPLVTLERPSLGTIDLELASGSAGGAMDDNIVNAIRDTQTYVNIHTDAFVNGEVRGQLIPARTNISPIAASVPTDIELPTVSAFYSASSQTINISIDGSYETRRVALSTVDGKIVSRTTTNNGRCEIDAAGLASGVYYVLIEGAGMQPVSIRR